MLKGFKQGLGANASRMIVAEASYEVTDPTIDSQIVSLKAAGADTLMLFAVPRFSAQALKKTAASNGSRCASSRRRRPTRPR